MVLQRSAVPIRLGHMKSKAFVASDEIYPRFGCPAHGKSGST